MLSIKKIILRFTPRFALSWYHFVLAFFAALRYWFPSEHMVVIGVTGTKGKTSVVYLLFKILQEAGLKVAVSSSLMIKINEEELRSEHTMTMAGRFALQKFLYKAKNARCSHVIMEVTSEGIAQHRHRCINFDISVFTNLTPEHIESHGGFENYKKAKGKLFSVLKTLKHKIIEGKKIEKISIINMDDAHALYFANFWADKKYGFGISNICKFSENIKGVCVFPSSFRATSDGITFTLDNIIFSTTLLGEFNVVNALCATVIAGSIGISAEISKSTLEKIKNIPGRAQLIEVGQSFTAIVDYAHTPSSYEEILKFAKIRKTRTGKIIVMCGSAGGGRDKWKRFEIGKIIARIADYIIITDEYPYDENPDIIFEQIKEGVRCEHFTGALEVLRDRKEAILRAIHIAQASDIVLFLGKGTEKEIVFAKGRSVPWDEAEIVSKEIKRVMKDTSYDHKAK